MTDSPPHPAALPIEQLLAACRIRRTRRSGPGGQHRNKVETAIVLTHEPSGITAEANERRSQAENRREAIWRLRLKLALTLRHPVADPYVPSPLWQKRLQGDRLAVRADHPDLPALLAEALDVLVSRDLRFSHAAQMLGCTSSQLVRLLKTVPAALHHVNERRVARNMKPIQ